MRYRDITRSSVDCGLNLFHQIAYFNFHQLISFFETRNAIMASSLLTAAFTTKAERTDLHVMAHLMNGQHNGAPLISKLAIQLHVVQHIDHHSCSRTQRWTGQPWSIMRACLALAQPLIDAKLAIGLPTALSDHRLVQHFVTYSANELVNVSSA